MSDAICSPPAPDCPRELGRLPQRGPAGAGWDGVGDSWGLCPGVPVASMFQWRKKVGAEKARASKPRGHNTNAAQARGSPLARVRLIPTSHYRSDLASPLSPLQFPRARLLPYREVTVGQAHSLAGTVLGIAGCSAASLTSTR